MSTSELNGILRDEIAFLLSENNTGDNDNWELPSDHSPYVILVVGVNGVGKTTTIGKLAYQFKNAGKKVFLGAADTFRAAAVEQIAARVAAHQEYSFVLEGTNVEIDYRSVGRTRGDQLVFVRFDKAARGIWTLSVYPDTTITGNFHVWLPMKGICRM